jgi:chromosome segregation ATPase
LKAKQEIERLRQDLKIAEEQLAKLEGCEKYILELTDLLEEQQLQLQIYEQPKEQICQRCRLHTAKDAEAEKLMAVENAKQSQAEADEIRKELRNVSDMALEIYRDFDTPTALGNVETEKIQAFETPKKLQAEADSRTLDRWLHIEMVVQTVEKSLKQLHSAIGHALAERMVAIENTKKTQAEMDELRNELEFYLKEVVSIRQELDRRLGVEAEVECLDARIAELQQQLAGCHRKSKEYAEWMEVQCVKLEVATAHLRDTDRKLLEMECAMLVCVAEEARLVEELEAGLNREKELQQQLTMLRQLTHQPRRQDAALALAESTK